MENTIMVTNAEQTDPMQLLGDLQATTARLGRALQARDASYQHLSAKYEALRHVVNGIFNESEQQKSVAESYILVLVDAQSHQFRENYVHGAESGGRTVAALLKNATRKQFDSKQCDVSPYRTLIRVYGNLKKLSVDSTEEYAAKKPGFGKPAFPRSLGAFAAGFSQDDACVDYVDVADDAAVEHKICELFRTNIKDPSCQHIFFGASGSARYVCVLRDHLMFSNKITLIQCEDKDISFTNLGLPSVVFSEVFGPLKPKQVASYLKESLKNSKSRQVRKQANITYPDVGSNQKNLSRTHVESLHSPPTHLAPLPLGGPPGTIPINAAGHRIDLHMDMPTNRQWAEYNACTAIRMLCDMFHIGQGCHREHCTYDHDPITFNQRYCYRFVRRAWTCVAGGTCRNAYCFKGHICHCEISENGKFWRCKMPAKYHGIDRTVARWVTPDEEHEGQDENGRDRETRTQSLSNLAMSLGNLIDV